jgi:hypothetical protein
VSDHESGCLLDDLRDRVNGKHSCGRRTVMGDYISKYELEAMDSYPMRVVYHIRDGLQFLAYVFCFPLMDKLLFSST